MARFATGWERPARKLLPRSLLGRSLLIILIPLLLVQGVALALFYGSHLDLISRRLSAAVAGEIAEIISQMDAGDPAHDALLLEGAGREFDLLMTVEPGARLLHVKRPNVLGPMDDDFAVALRERVGRPYDMDWQGDPQSVLVQVQLPGGVLHVAVPRKRLTSSMVYVYVLWIVGTSSVLFVVAALFMRNQVRAIRRLSAAAEAFGLGRDEGPIRPEGAAEVRRAAGAFNRMQERIRRFLAQRTEMLAGVSHDIRTPLTRLRLALAMLPAEGAAADEVVGMTADVEEMERMIAGYLAFARGEQQEQAVETDLAALLAEVAAGARRAGAEVRLDAPAGPMLKLRPDAVRRAITNLVDNARRHARVVCLTAVPLERSVQVLVDDDGPGIPPERRESVFRPFESDVVDGTGLGLTIARDIVRAHGGDIALEDAPLGGLRARVRLPVGTGT